MNKSSFFTRIILISLCFFHTTVYGLQLKTTGKKAVLNLTSFGAKGDRVFLNTNSIQTAIDQLASQGGGILFSKNVRIAGVIVKNSSCWVQTYDQCTNLIIDSIRVESDAYWNNDGIDISDCSYVRHLEGLTLNNVSITAREKDFRPAFFLMM